MKFLCKLGFHDWEEKPKKYKVWNSAKKGYDFNIIPHRKCNICDKQEKKTIITGGNGFDWKILKKPTEVPNKNVGNKV